MCPKLKLQVVSGCTTQYDYKKLHQTSTVTHLSTHAQLSDTLIDNLGYCDSVEVVYLHASQDAVLSMQGLTSLCEKWPSLRVLVVEKEDIARFTDLTWHQAQLTVTGDKSSHNFSIMKMPI